MGFLEISVNRGSAAKQLAIVKGAEVRCGWVGLRRLGRRTASLKPRKTFQASKTTLAGAPATTLAYAGSDRPGRSSRV